MKEGIRLADYKLALLSIKYIPVVMFLIMWIHTGLLILGINLGVADTIAGCAVIPSILILSISRMLHFCYIHKLLTVYSLLIDLCINWNRYVGFGILLSPIRVFFFTIGTLLLIKLLLNFRKYTKNCVNINEFVKHVTAYKETTIKDN